jgi:hypothetical protein
MENFILSKEQAAAIFGENLHAAVGLSRQAVSMWPDPLPAKRINEVLGLALRRYGAGRLTVYGHNVVIGFLQLR